MMKRALMGMVLLALFAAGMVLPAQSHAQSPPAPYSEIPNDPAPIKKDIDTKKADGSTTGCNAIPEAKDGVLLGKIVPCLVYTIQEATITFAAQMSSFIQPIVDVFMLVVVVLYGVRVLQQEPEIYKQGFVLLVKIAIIMTILADLGNVQAYDGSGGGGKLIPAVYGIMSESQKVVTGAIDNSTTMKCDLAKYKGGQTPAVWAMMDCVMGKLYGFTTGTDPNTGTKAPSMLLMTSVAGLLTGFLFGGAWGVVVFFGMIALLFSIFMLVIRTVVGFITGYLIICLLLIMSPLFLPLIFLRGTLPYFQSYWQVILSAFIAPLIITSYSMFALMLYDQMLFAPNSIVAKLFDYDMIKDAMQPSKKPCDRQTTVDPLDVRFDSTPTTAEKNTLFSMPNLQNLSFPTLSGGNDLCGSIKLPVFKMDKMKNSVPGKQQDELNQIFMELVTLGLLGWLIAEGQKALSSIIPQLVGRRSVSIAVDSFTENSRFTQGFENAKQSAINRFRKTPGDTTSGFKSGGDYVSDLPSAVKDITKSAPRSYFNTLRK